MDRYSNVFFKDHNSSLGFQRVFWSSKNRLLYFKEVQKQKICSSALLKKIYNVVLCKMFDGGNKLGHWVFESAKSFLWSKSVSYFLILFALQTHKISLGNRIMSFKEFYKVINGQPIKIQA